MDVQPLHPIPGDQNPSHRSRTSTHRDSVIHRTLNILLQGPVYHGGTQNTMGSPIEIKSWTQILRHWLSPNPQDRQITLNLLRQRLDGCAAITNAPGAQLVPELLELYPEAKTICTVRDPDVWIKSMDQVAGLATLWFLRVALLPLPGMRHFVDYIDIYELHVEWLKKVIPEDRLVFFHISDGINDSEAIAQTAKYHIQRGLVRWAGILSVVGVAVAAVAVR
ncbi:hypothetical protein BDV24DRAFT_149364 [Aspergillus arachidicola]|uniref:NAD dependent epimerase/dehydratase n=1 Tax=Aspergillus arachidicola TaxID=656916 RepID=A0A5N6YE78_9EURO|nr:hypothetical protein BDV24DRAFT_149364 [Aspergillus arachidicola]